MQIDISKYIKAAKTQTEKDADILLRAYLEDLVTTREATIDEVSKAYGKYLDGVEPANYVIEMNKAGRMDKLIDRVTEIEKERERKSDKYLENQARVGTNQYYYMMFIYSALGVAFEDMDDATYYAIIGRDPSAKIKVDGKVWTVGDYIKETVKDKTARDIIYRDFFASTGGSTIDKIVTINAKHREAIESIIRNGIMSGKSMKEIGTLLKKQFDTAAYIGERIARTEVKRAYEASQWDAHNEAKAQGIEAVRIWHATQDTRTRAQSVSMDGQEQDADGLFHYPNGAVGRYPGDSGVAEYDIHERCWVGEYVEGDTPSGIMASRDLGDTLSTEKGYGSFEAWRKSQGITRNKYGEYYDPANKPTQAQKDKMKQDIKDKKINESIKKAKEDPFDEDIELFKKGGNKFKIEPDEWEETVNKSIQKFKDDISKPNPLYIKTKELKDLLKGTDARTLEVKSKLYQLGIRNKINNLKDIREFEQISQREDFEARLSAYLRGDIDKL